MERTGSAALSLREFLRSVYAPTRLDLSAAHVTQMEMCVSVFTAWLGRNAQLTDVCETTVRQFLSDYRMQRAPATVNAKRRMLLAMWTCAWEEGLLAEPPRKGKIRRCREGVLSPEAWTPGEVGRLLAATDDLEGLVGKHYASIWWRSIIMVAYDTGARISSILALECQDVSIAGGWVRFRKTKTGREQLCNLAKDTCDALRALGVSRPGPVWIWPLSREWLGVQLKRLCARAGITCGRGSGGLWHKFRRTSGSLVEANGGDGAKHLGNTRAVFERHYLDTRLLDRSSVQLLPRPLEPRL